MSNGIAILAGVAKRLSWRVDYFDTYIYEKKRDSMEDRETTAECRPSKLAAALKHKPFSSLKTDLQKKKKGTSQYIIKMFSYNQFVHSFCSIL